MHSEDATERQGGKRDQADFRIANVCDGIELLKAQYFRQTFSKHIHEGYTIGVIEQGAQQFYRSGANHIADENSIILVNADQVHTGQSATSYGWAYRAIYPLPEQFAAVCQEVFESRDGKPYFPEAVIRDPELAAQLRLLMTSLENTGERLLNETLLYAVMTRLVMRHSRTRHSFKRTPNSSHALDLVKSFLDDHPEADVSLESLARTSGLSPFHLTRQFKQRFGIPPHAYQIQARLRLAKSLLKKGERPAQVAVDCGFHDQSHLTHHFKRALGITPGQFARHSRNLQF